MYKPLGEGYIAVVLPKLEEAQSTCCELLTEEEYKEYLHVATKP